MTRRLKAKYKIMQISHGSWEHVRGDIIGIDRRRWFSSRPDTYLVQNIKTGTVYRKEFMSKYAAKQFVAQKKK